MYNNNQTLLDVYDIRAKENLFFLKKVLTNAKKSDILVKLSMRQANKNSWC